MSMGSDMNMVAGLLMGSMHLGVVFEKYDHINDKLYISIPSNFCNATDDAGLVAAVQRQKQVFTRIFHFSDRFGIRFKVRDEEWTEEKTKVMEKDIKENGLGRHLNKISNLVGRMSGVL